MSERPGVREQVACAALIAALAVVLWWVDFIYSPYAKAYHLPAPGPFHLGINLLISTFVAFFFGETMERNSSHPLWIQRVQAARGYVTNPRVAVPVAVGLGAAVLLATLMFPYVYLAALEGPGAEFVHAFVVAPGDKNPVDVTEALRAGQLVWRISLRSKSHLILADQHGVVREVFASDELFSKAGYLSGESQRLQRFSRALKPGGPIQVTGEVGAGVRVYEVAGQLNPVSGFEPFGKDADRFLDRAATALYPDPEDGRNQSGSVEGIVRGFGAFAPIHLQLKGDPPTLRLSRVETQLSDEDRGDVAREASAAFDGGHPNASQHLLDLLEAENSPAKLKSEVLTIIRAEFNQVATTPVAGMALARIVEGVSRHGRPKWVGERDASLVIDALNDVNWGSADACVQGALVASILRFVPLEPIDARVTIVKQLKGAIEGPQAADVVRQAYVEEMRGVYGALFDSRTADAIADSLIALCRRKDATERAAASLIVEMEERYTWDQRKDELHEASPAGAIKRAAVACKGPMDSGAAPKAQEWWQCLSH